MDLFNNELISYGVSDRRGDPMTYYDGLEDLIKTKKEYSNFTTILHIDGSSIYKSYNYNIKLNLNGFIHAMSTPCRSTENGAMEAING